MRIGVLTGGGDVPGLNPCIKALVYRAVDEGHEVLGIRRGWAGLLFFNPDDPTTQSEHVIPLNKAVVRTIDRTGGTFLHTSRTNPGRVAPEKAPPFLSPEAFPVDANGYVDFTKHVLRVLEYLKLDVLVPIGGEDTLGYAARIHKEGFPIISIPKTMDNDVFGTDYCIGFSTAVTRSVRFIHQLRSTAGSHERICVVELFGRHSGETSLISAYLAWADRAIISEVPFDIEKLAHLLLKDKYSNPSRYAIVTISEGAREIGKEVIQSGAPDPYGHKKLGGIGAITAKRLEQITGEGTMCQELAYLMRSGEPDSLDIMVAVNYANVAMDLIQEKKFGRMVALREGRYTDVDAATPTLGTKHVDVRALYDVDEYRPKVFHAHGKPMFLY
ncbi:MAG: 6-phosphofructokinase [Anaerolineae bacterium]|nr:6-phosphofructokinase [Anaerolineae bacterium]MCX8067421.1 6-phosphofructokinase [Anaerolineae bacterium]MDW7991161.1 6-phosphofructokinase [Anaerolineae bacterium]